MQMSPSRVLSTIANSSSALCGEERVHDGNGTSVRLDGGGHHSCIPEAGLNKG